MPRAPGQGGFTHSLIGNLASLRASLTYVTGAHNMKFGYQGGFGNPSQTYQNYTPGRAGPDEQRRAEPADADDLGGARHQVRPQSHPDEFLRAGPVDAQPADPAGRRAVRLADLELSRPAHRRPRLAVRPGGDLLPEPVDARVRLEGHHAAGGRRLRPVREREDGGQVQHRQVSRSHHGEQQRSGHEPADPHGREHDARVDATRTGTSCRIAISTTRRRTANARGWTTRTWGRPVFTRNFDPDYVGGWGTRPYNWSMGLSVQHEVVPRVSVTVAFNRNWWGNWYVVDNRATSLADYTPFSIQAPLDPRLPGGGGQTIGGLYNLVPAQGRAGGRARAVLQELRRADRELAGHRCLGGGAAAERAHGAGGHEHRAQARGRLRRAGQAAGAGHRHRHGVATNSSVTANVNALGGGPFALSVNNPYCRIAEPYRTDFRGLASYIVPKVDVQLAATWASIPGDSLRADYIATNAWIAAGPQPLGRTAHRGRHRPVNLIAAGHVVGRAAQQRRHAHREDSPLRDDADPGGRRHLQPAERRHGHELQLRVRTGWLVADSDDHHAGAVRQDQRAVRLLIVRSFHPAL